jgi:hypothetical protein
MAKRKTLRKTKSKLRKQNTVVVFETIIRPEETLFPEKLKKVNEILARTKMLN